MCVKIVKVTSWWGGQGMTEPAANVDMGPGISNGVLLSSIASERHLYALNDPTRVSSSFIISSIPSVPGEVVTG